MRQENPGRGDLIGPLDWLKKVPFAPAAASEGLGWVGLEATRFRAAPPSELKVNDCAGGCVPPCTAVNVMPLCERLIS